MKPPGRGRNLEERHDLGQGDGHRLGLVVQVVVQPAFGDGDVLVRRGSAAVDFPAVAVGSPGGHRDADGDGSLEARHR